MVTKLETTAIVTAVLAVFIAALAAAYQSGYLDPFVERAGMYFFKVKAEAEKKKLQAQGQKLGEDFMEGDLPGNQQAEHVVKSGLGGVTDIGGSVGGQVTGGLGGLTKGL